ncbi:MAG: acylphosphatase [Elsteraceae bacterium]
MAIRLTIAGIVQGVGYRDWMAREAQALDLAGYVVNRRNGTVEALIDGEADDIATMIEACRRGPRLAKVSAISQEEVDEEAPYPFQRREGAR